MKILIACETSGVVREAFRLRGHEVYSCDLLPSQDDSPFHLECDVRAMLRERAWDLMIAHPPCTYLCNSGVRWFTTIPKHPDPDVVYGEDRWRAMAEGAQLFKDLWNAPIPKIVIENPVMHKYAREAIGGMKFSQTIQPWEFGHGEVKRTCLWIKGLRFLYPTDIVDGRHPACFLAAPRDRWQIRSNTYPGIAKAMAEQWG